MPDALILGGGLAGSATAVLLARTGQSVHLIERETGPHHKICGEFLSIEAHQHLSELGIDPLALGAVPIERIHLIFGNAFIEAPLPFKALGLSRYTLDETLIGQATAAGAKVERGVRVLEIGQDQVRTSAGARSGRHVILATGKLPVRQEQHPRRKEDDNPYVGFKMHYRLGSAARRRLDGVIQLILFDGGYAGLQLIEGGHANLCLIIRRRRLQQLGRKWADVAKMLTSLKHCRTILADAEPLFPRPLTIANLVYSGPRRFEHGDPIFRLGDQAAMTAPLSGDGMALALRSAAVAAQCIGEGLGADEYRLKYHTATKGQLFRAMALQDVLDRPVLRALGISAARAWPGLLTRAAEATRLPEWSAASHTSRNRQDRGAISSKR